MERDNYIQAVAREFFIPYEALKRLVNNLGNKIGFTPQNMEEREREKKSLGGRKKDKEDGIRQSQRLLLTWLIENPGLFEKIDGIITAEDFKEPLYYKVAALVFEGHAAGKLEPAGILNHFINDEEEYRDAAALFNASLNESLGNEEQKKAFSETVLKVKKNSLDYASRNVKNIEELQNIIREQAALESLHISLE